MPIRLTHEVRRRFILGKQGLWPGRRWAGRDGTAEALRAVDAVQIDPVSIIAQSHDIVLWGRVHDYQRRYLAQLIEAERQFFDYGGALFIYPMEELPYWRLHMERFKEVSRWKEFSGRHPEVIERVRAEIHERGPLRKRDLDGARVSDYRGSRDSGVALHYLWLTGELMTHHRQGKERVYDFRENIAPSRFDYSASVSEAEDFFARKTVSHQGIVTDRLFRSGWGGNIGRTVSPEEARTKLGEMLSRREVLSLELEAQREPAYILEEDFPSVEALLDGRVPDGWKPVHKSTEEEVIFLSPLEYVSARGRAKKLFDFDYVWEIYKPAELRRWGPYTLPILYRERLVGRMDAKFSTQESALCVNGLWLETWFEPAPGFVEALRLGLARLLRFLGASRLEIEGGVPESLRAQLETLIEK